MNFSTIFDGRVGRKAYAQFTGLSVATLLAIFIVERVIMLLLYPDNHDDGLAALLDVMLVLLAASRWLLGLFIAGAFVVLSTRRFHDIGYSGLCTLPVVALIALSGVSVVAGAVALLAQFFLLIAEGERGRNRHGDAPTTGLFAAKPQWR